MSREGIVRAWSRTATDGRSKSQRKFGVKHPDGCGGDAISRVVWVNEGKVRDGKSPLQCNVENVPDKLEAEIDATAEGVFGGEDEVSGGDAFVVAKDFGGRIEDLGVGTRPDKGVSEVRRDQKHSSDRKMFADDDIACEVKEIEIARVEEAVDADANGDIREIIEAFVEGPFDGDCAEHMAAVVDKTEATFDLKAEGETFSEAKAGDDHVVVGAFVFNGPRPMG